MHSDTKLHRLFMISLICVKVSKLWNSNAIYENTNKVLVQARFQPDTYVTCIWITQCTSCSSNIPSYSAHVTSWSTKTFLPEVLIFLFEITAFLSEVPIFLHRGPLFLAGMQTFLTEVLISPSWNADIPSLRSSIICVPCKYS